MIAQELSQRYDCALLNLDQVIIDAIDSSQRSEYAQRAYHMCRDAMEKHVDEQRQAEVDADHAPTTAQLGIGFDHVQSQEYVSNSNLSVFQVLM
jgi:hypothetical protein